MKKSTLISMILLGIVGGSLSGGKEAVAHGYVASPTARGYMGALAKNSIGWQPALEKYGQVITNPQSLEAPKGFPEAGPVDGRIASANGGSGQIGDFVLDEQGMERWDKVDMTGGPNVMTWAYTAPHRTSKWHYYITKKGWNPNDKLDRGDFELLQVVEHDGSSSSNNLSHLVNVPTDRSGYHVILAVWDVADTGNAFYNVIDVNLRNDGITPPIDDQAPTIPDNLKATMTAHSATLSWSKSEDNTGVKEYIVLRDGKEVGRSGSTSFTDERLKAETAYSYTVKAVDFSGNVSKESQSLTVKTLAIPEVDTEAPSIPGNLHSMGETASTISLMWNKATDNVGVTGYVVYRDGKKLTTVKGTMFEDSGLSSDTKYSYQITAIDAQQNESEKSNQLTVTTKTSVPSDEREWKSGESYTAGEKVIYKGIRYVVIQTHTNYGDPTWAPDVAPTLFGRI